ncbi:MAG: tetratricopeptide repeat protein [Candidatus Palauibacterales bacterium]|nr:tetratricopeptide repeat protein [Candidatus Palauibacterales bacterium]
MSDAEMDPPAGGAGTAPIGGSEAADEDGQLLAILAFMGAGPVPLWLFAEGHDLLPPPLESVAAAGAGALDAPARRLARRHLVHVEAAEVRVPPEVGSAVRESMTGVERSRFAGLALSLLDRGFPERIGQPEDTGRSEALAAAIEAVAGHVTGGGSSTARAAHLLGRVGSFHGLSGDPEQARRALARAIALAEGEAGGGGLDGPIRAVLADEHAAILVELDRLEDARQEARRALRLAEQALPEDAPQLPVFLLNVGRTLRQAGDVDGSREALVRALELAGAADSAAARPLVVEARLALAELALGEGEADEAVSRAGAALEEIYERDEPELVGRAAWILADALREAGSTEEATELYRHSLEADVRRYGAGHPGVGQKLLGLGLHFEDLGRIPEAIEAYGRAVVIFEEALGPESEPARSARACLERVSGRS